MQWTPWSVYVLRMTSLVYSSSSLTRLSHRAPQTFTEEWPDTDSAHCNYWVNIYYTSANLRVYFTSRRNLMVSSNCLVILPKSKILGKMKVMSGVVISNEQHKYTLVFSSIFFTILSAGLNRFMSFKRNKFEKKNCFEQNTLFFYFSFW